MRIILLASLIWMLLKLYYLWLAHRYKQTEQADEIHFATTIDNRSIAVARYRPRSETERAAPLILCHGMGANRHNLSTTGKYDLASEAARRGYDVWVVDLRGGGLSNAPALDNHYKYDWNFDDHINKDVPAVIEMIRKKTGSKKVYWVGHSMGGMLLYAHGIATGNSDILAGAALGSPGVFCDFKPDLVRLTALAPLLKLIPAFHAQHIFRFILPFIGKLKKTDFIRSQFTIENVEIEDIKRAAYNTVVNIPSSMLLQFVDWIKDETFCSVDGSDIWADSFDKLKIPVLFIAGGGDQLVPVSSVEKAYRKCGSKKKKLLIASKANGFIADYGHDDLVFGLKTDTEIYEPVFEWLAGFPAK